MNKFFLKGLRNNLKKNIKIFGAFLNFEHTDSSKKGKEKNLRLFRKKKAKIFF